MRAYVSNEIVIENPTAEVLKRFAEILTFDNPEYTKKLRMGKWLGNTPEYLSLYKRIGERLIIPFGMISEVFRMRELFDSIENQTGNGRFRTNYGSSILPYDYQEEAIKEAIARRNGVIVAPCGSGKTMIGLEIIARLGLRTLWLTHTHDLLKQSMERAKSVFSLPDSSYGTITAGKINAGSVLTFATVQTMSKIDLAGLKDYFDVIVVDEAHHVVGGPTRVQMFYKVISELNARYKFGLTATPKRGDGLIGCMYALLGEKIYEVTKKQVEQNLCPVTVIVHDINYVPNLDAVLAPDGTLVYSSLISDIVSDNNRNEQILGDIKAVNGKSLVLTDRVAHATELYMATKDSGLRGILLVGKTSKSVRERAIEDIKSGRADVLFATYALAKEGLDIPNLEHVFLTTPQKDETTVIQSAGRVARKADGKTMGYVHDYVDSFGMLRGWAKKREGFYKKSEYLIAHAT